jgi:chromosome segregation ATPase
MVLSRDINNYYSRVLSHHRNLQPTNVPSSSLHDPIPTLPVADRNRLAPSTAGYEARRDAHRLMIAHYREQSVDNLVPLLDLAEKLESDLSISDKALKELRERQQPLQTELDEVRGKLEKAVDDHRTELQEAQDKLRQESDDHQQKMKEADDELKEITSAHETVQKSRELADKDMRNKLEAAEARQTVLEQAGKKCQEQLEHAKKRLNEMTSAHEALEKSKKAAEEDARKKLEAANSAQAELQQTDRDRQKELDDTNTKLTEMNNAHETLETSHQAEQEAHNTLKTSRHTEHELVKRSVQEAQSALKELQTKFDKAKTESESLQRLRIQHEASQIETKERPTHEAYTTATKDEKQVADKTEVEKQRAQFSTDIEELRAQARETAKERDEALKRANDLQQTNLQLQDQSRGLQTAQDQAMRNIDSLGAEIVTKEEELTKLRNFLIERGSELERVKEKNERFDETQRELHETIQGLRVSEDLLGDRFYEMAELDELSKKVKLLEDDLAAANNNLATAREQEQTLRAQLKVAEKEDEANSDLVDSLRWCRAKLIHFMIVTFRIDRNPMFMDIKNDPADEIVDRTLSQLKMCKLVFGGMESLIGRTLDAHKETCELLHKSKLSMLVYEGQIDEHGKLIRFLRGEKAILMRRADSLQIEAVTMDDQIKGLRGQLKRSVEAWSALKKNRDSLLMVAGGQISG